MEFQDKYSDDVKDVDEKKIISKDAFAIGDIIQNLINKIEHVRIDFIK